MNALWTSGEAAKATGGTAIGEWEVSGLSIDTRSITSADLFIPLKDQRDGHDFIPNAVSIGAPVISERPIENVPALKVEDSLKALEALAVAARERCFATRIVVTGSVGKTSVKEAIAHALAPSGKTHKSLKSLNNHWGVPLTLALMPKESQYGVFEAGMNHAGELSGLSKLVKPHVAIITKIAAAHLEHFANIEAIASAKAEIFDGMAEGGTAILPKDDEFFEYLSARARVKGLTVIGIGKDDLDRSVTLQSTGEHHYLNAAFALAAVRVIGANVDKARASLEAMAQLPGRGETFETVFAGKRIAVIDESYNANPASMRASIAAAATHMGRKLAVLGDMKELGETADERHADLLAPLQAAGFEKVITLGAHMSALRDVLPEQMNAAWLENTSGVLAALSREIENNDVVLFKASNSVGLGPLITKLKKDAV